MPWSSCPHARDIFCRVVRCGSRRVVGLGFGAAYRRVHGRAGWNTRPELDQRRRRARSFLFNVVAFALVEVPLLGYLAAPDKTRALIAALHDWIRSRRLRAIAPLLAAAGCFLDRGRGKRPLRRCVHINRVAHRQPPVHHCSELRHPG